MTENPFDGVADKETVKVLTALEACTWNVVRSIAEIFWCREKAWKTYRLSSQDIAKSARLQPSDMIEIYWWAFVNYVYQFEQKTKLYLNCFNKFAPFYGLEPIESPGKLIKKTSKRLKEFTAYRGDSVHNWHIPPDVVGQLPLVEHMQSQREIYRRFPGTEYLDLPPKHLFRLTRRRMRSKMESAMATMETISTDLTAGHKSEIYSACYKLSSYTQWAKAGHTKLKFR